MKKVLILCPGPDTGGSAIALKTAFDHHPEVGWEARAVRRVNNYIDYPADIHWKQGDEKTGKLVHALFEQADVIHCVEIPNFVKEFKGWERKAIIVRHLGTQFRSKPRQVTAEIKAIGAIEAVGSHELMQYAGPDAELLLPVADLDYIRSIRERLYVPSEYVRVVHAPTNRVIKGTEHFLKVMERLSQRYHVKVRLIEGKTRQETLELKAQADIYYDQLDLGYGLNAIEAWAMGVPVIAGLQAAPAAKRAFHEHFGYYPFMDTTTETLEQHLAILIESRAERQLRGEIGQLFAEENHSGAAITRATAAVYEKALARK